MRRLLLVGFIAAGPLYLSPAALASCVMPPPMPQAIRDARTVFVGTVVELENNGRLATVEVEEIWKGSDVPATVRVTGADLDTGAVTSVDRSFELSGRYLFVPFDRKKDVFLDNACTSTTSYREGLARFRPSSAETPSPLSTEGEDEPADGSAPFWIYLLPVGLVVLGVLVVRLRRSSSG